MTKKTLEQASQLVLSSGHPLLVCHLAPDGDAIGSLTGLGRALAQMGKAPVLACPDAVPQQLAFIPGAALVVQDVSEPFDLIIALDCSDLGRLGHFTAMPTFAEAPLVNIDHHVTNQHFGDVNLVDAEATSTAGLVLRLLDHLGVPLDAELATSLLTGIVTDTRGFRTSNVAVPAVEAALRLMRLGASLPRIVHYALDSRNTSALRLWGAALTGLKIDHGLIWTSITAEMRHRVGHGGDSDAGLVDFLVGADEADAAVVFVECDDHRVEIGLRAVSGFDVARVAGQFGGGGHALASGCTLVGPLEAVQDRVLTALQADLARQRSNHA